MSGEVLFRRDGRPWSSTLLRRADEWGIEALDLVNPPRRLWVDEPAAPPIVEIGVDSRQADPVPSPARLLASGPQGGESWLQHSKRSLARAYAYFLLAEDPQRRLDIREVETLAHQVSLVRHVLEHDALRRVLIADEVGLGKTVEAGLLLAELLQSRPGLRVLYLAPARLVRNVRAELTRLDLHFRQWTATEPDARLSDPLVVASIHRAVVGKNPERFLEAQPWDVLIVDECHHLSAWAPGGGDPRKAYRLVRDLIRRQGPESRVIFLSGTPHQGSPVRFENLLDLLLRDGEDRAGLDGRVILRTKEDVRDWAGRPLFPQREVRPTTIVDLGPAYRAWINAIHEHFSPSEDEGRGPEAQLRAVGWRCAQALQWATSSVQAGLGYLMRQALRAGWPLDHPTLREGAAALRPYRMGSPQEAPESVLARMQAEIQRQRDDGDIEDIEDDPESASLIVDPSLVTLIQTGISLLGSQDTKWDLLAEQVLGDAGTEKVVLFAQPIETVGALADFIWRRFGVKPAVIIGGQSDEERQAQVTAFRDPAGPQFLVSSRAGGEGINLQVARRLVHVDVPWNPMELEQRVGRVHRFGSRKTILVDTLVVKDSREAYAYAVARKKLEHIATVLGGSERFEALFSRVMSLVPPEDIVGVLIKAPLAPIDQEGQQELARMVQAGFERWRAFHAKYGERQKLIEAQNPGLASWADVRAFALDHAGAEEAPGVLRQVFRSGQAGVELDEEPVAAIRFRRTSAVLALGAPSGLPSFDTAGQPVGACGLNTPALAAALRETALDGTPAGAAHLRAPRSGRPACLPDVEALGVLVVLRQTLQVEGAAAWGERAISLHAYSVAPDGSRQEIVGPGRADVIRWLVGLTVRTAGPEGDLPAVLARSEREVVDVLRRPSESELAAGLRFGARPILAVIVAP